jgi:hypothetical protein
MGELIQGKFKQEDKTNYDKINTELAEIKYLAGMEMLKLSVIINDISGDELSGLQLLLPPGITITQDMLSFWYHPDLSPSQVYKRTAGFQERMPATNWELDLFYKGLIEI